MTNEEKAKEIAGYKPDEKPEIPMFQGQDGDKYACYESAMAMAQWKDAQFKQLLIEKAKLLSPSAAQDSVKRCTIEEIYRELFEKEMPNSNPYIK